MHPDWHTFLQQQGAVFCDGRVTAFGETASPPGATSRGIELVDLSGSEGCIAVSGSERNAFLQGQLSTDIRRLTAELCQFSSWNNPKGRVVATLHICAEDELLQLRLPRTLLETVITGLRQHVLRSKVVLTDTSDQAAAFGVVGARASQLLEDCGYQAPQNDGGVALQHGVQLMRLHGNLPRFAARSAVPAAQGLWDRLRERGAEPSGSEAWTLQRILARVPCIQPATSGHFVAQMLGLEELGAVHFNKGCYLGQEVIARAHYRGTVKRHLHRARCNSKATVFAGTEILDTAHAVATGEVVDACRDRDGLWQLLVVTQDGCAGADLHIHEAPCHLLD